MSSLLGRRTWTDIDADGPGTLLVPLGSTEQHGPHLPLDTDTRIAAALSERAADGLHDVAVAPALTYGASGEHQDFPGTLSIGTPALTAVLVELARSAAHTFRRVVFVSGHGGNAEALAAAGAVLSSEGRDVASWSPRVTGGDLHAGRTETSLMLAIAPEVVVRKRAQPGTTTPVDQIWEGLVRDGVRAHAPDGVLGDPTGANAGEGVSLLDRLAAELRRLLVHQSRQ